LSATTQVVISSPNGYDTPDGKTASIVAAQGIQAKGLLDVRLGIFGGSFNPVHLGHLILAECCREQLALDRVWFLPAATPPHKQQHDLLAGEQRAEMIELAIAGHAGFGVCRYELERGGVSYTVDTLQRFHDEQPTDELFFLMGADSLADLPTWKDPATICRLAIPVVVQRGDGARTPSLESDEFRALAHLVEPERLQQIASARVEMPRIDLSASDLRRRVAAGQSIRYRTPRAVEKYIETHGLYRP
jgi:nicotinate-nucleotide adenylyltransferase